MLHARAPACHQPWTLAHLHTIWQLSLCRLTTGVACQRPQALHLRPASTLCLLHALPWQHMHNRHCSIHISAAYLCTAVSFKGIGSTSADHEHTGCCAGGGR
jgi:hypothetical protein